MQKLQITRVITKKQLKDFINLPKKIYRNDDLWVPPLWILEKADYRNGGNTVLNRSEHVLFLVYRDRQPVGRILVYIDPRYNNYFNSSKGFFGSFESINDNDVGKLLFDAAEEWLKKKEMTEILGPIDPVAECWGFLLDGETPPVFMSPHNPLYYNQLIENSTYCKAKDLLVFEADCGADYTIPQRFSDFADKILEQKKNLSMRTISRKYLKRDAGYILTILNQAVTGNWGFVPVEEDEMEEIVGRLKLIMDENAIWFVEDNGVPVGIALGFPDINVVFKNIQGKLNPLALLTLLRERKKIRDYRLWGLAVLPEYHGLGLDVLLYVSLARALELKKIRMEANYMLEDNRNILNALEKMGLKEIKKYRIYEKNIGCM